MDRREVDDSAGEVEAGLAQVRTYWEGRARARLPDLERLEWTHRRTQRLRFEVFLADHDLRGRSVLDLGCGLGDFHAHLRQRGLDDVEYTGFDIAEAMARQCRDRYPGVRFEHGDVLAYEPACRFDYTVAFGIHNIRVPGGRAILERVTQHQYALSGVAAHVALLSDRHAFAPHIQAWPVDEILAMALRITPYVALHHDYLPGDFSVTLYRQPIARSRMAAALDY